MKKLAVGLALTVGAAAPAFAVDCASFPDNTIATFVNEDVYANDITCTIARTGHVNGNLYQSGDGGLIIRGRVNGGVEETGPGGITLRAGANVNGEIAEFDIGSIAIRGGATLGGNVKEHDAGSVTITVDLPGIVNGNVYESGRGSAIVRTVAGDFIGSVFETEAGNVEVTIASGTVFNGGLEEEHQGHVIVWVDGRYEGNLTELDDGDLSTAGNGAVNGNSEHELPGRCSNAVDNFEGAICIQL